MAAVRTWCIYNNLYPSVNPWVPASAGKAKTSMVHSVSGWMRVVQVKLWDPLRTRAIPECLRGVITTRRYTNPRLPLPLPLPSRALLDYCVIWADFQLRIDSWQKWDREKERERVRSAEVSHVNRLTPKKSRLLWYRTVDTVYGMHCTGITSAKKLISLSAASSTTVGQTRSSTVAEKPCDAF